MDEKIFVLLKILGFGATSFVIALLITPFVIKLLSKYGRKETRKFLDFHSAKDGTPTMGGVIIWITAVFLILGTFILSKIIPAMFERLNFLTRPQTYLPLATLLFAAVIGLLDDILGILKKNWLRIKHRLILFAGAGLVGAWWFHYKLEWETIHIPFMGNFAIDGWYIPLFVLVIVASAFSANETDGLDGLLAGVMAITFFIYTIISFSMMRYELAIFCAVVAGALLAFLWFNIYPARFFMGDTGSVSLGITAGVISMLTNTALLLPFFMFIPFIETLSVILQIGAVKTTGKKIFLFTPIHHHFEKLGWPETQITMRFWIMSAVAAAIGLLLFFLDKQLT